MHCVFRGRRGGSLPTDEEEGTSFWNASLPAFPEKRHEGLHPEELQKVEFYTAPAQFPASLWSSFLKLYAPHVETNSSNWSPARNSNCWGVLANHCQLRAGCSCSIKFSSVAAPSVPTGRRTGARLWAFAWKYALDTSMCKIENAFLWFAAIDFCCFGYVWRRKRRGSVSTDATPNQCWNVSDWEKQTLAKNTFNTSKRPQP